VVFALYMSKIVTRQKGDINKASISTH
jgi:hypothetical protein